MGRMDRHKNEPRKREPQKSGFSIRRERNKSSNDKSDNKPDMTQSNSPYQASNEWKKEAEEQYYYQQEMKQKKSNPFKNRFTPKNPRNFGMFNKQPKRKRSIFQIIAGIFVFMLLFSGITFAFGYFSARSDKSIPKAQTEEFNGEESENGTENILILGSDTRETEQGRADSIMVLQMDGKGKPKMVSFMRDMYVTIPGVGDNKLNASYAYGGADLTRQTLKNNFGVDCKYYAKVDFQSFEKGIDALFPRGIKIDAEKDMSSYIDQPIQKGEQRMNGHTLLNYARFRMDEEGDFGRVRRQQQVMSAIFRQMRNPLTFLRGPYAAGKFLGYLSNDIPAHYFIRNSFHFLKAAGGFERLSVPVEGTWEYGDTYDAGSVLFVDNQQNSQAIASFLNDN